MATCFECGAELPIHRPGCDRRAVEVAKVVDDGGPIDQVMGRLARRGELASPPPGVLDVVEVLAGPDGRRIAEALAATYLGAFHPQPAPTGNGPEVLPVVLQFLTERQAKSIPKYGTVLRAHNGRDALRDAVEEAADKLMYLVQFQMEWPALVARVRADALEEAYQLAEAFLHSEPESGAAKDELDRTASYSNGTVRRILAGIRQLQGTPATGPEPIGPPAPTGAP